MGFLIHAPIKQVVAESIMFRQFATGGRLFSKFLACSKAYAICSTAQSS
jgi:hypothetical protein